MGYLEQVPTFSPEATVLATLLEGADDPYDWEAQVLADEMISKLSIPDPEAKVESLSGGWKKRVALGRELVRKPDLLLLDEPTNHLDVESILWLEALLAKSSFATLTITHDRLFLQRVANRILELDRRNPEGLLSIQGSYADYLETKEQLMNAQERREVILKNTLRRETEWLRQGAKARTTKQQARIQRAEELKDTVGELTYRNQTRSLRLDFQSGERNPKKLLEAKGISKSYGNRQIFSGVDLNLSPGKRLAILGPNGCGKSTLIRTLLGQENPDTGTVVRSENLSVAYFEQNRDLLDPEVSVAKTLCPHGEYVDYRGTRVHIRGYLDRFLFTSGQMEMAVGKLSGGEQSRLLVAQLMLKESNLLVLDEPTNDLDMATLAVLEECLTEFTGAVLLVTHDRYFLDSVATQIFAFGMGSDEGKSVFFSNLEQWEVWHAQQLKNLGGAPPIKNPVPSSGVTPSEKAVDPGTSEKAAKKRKLSFKEVRELETMEERIHQTEAALEKATAQSVLPENLANAVRLVEITQEMSRLQSEIDRLYKRWAELE